MANGFGEATVGSAISSCPTAQPPSYWLEIELVGDDDKPIPWEEFLVELPDGTKAPGYLDAQGYARFSNIPQSGDCKVSFPRLDQEAWEWISTEPERGTEA